MAKFLVLWTLQQGLLSSQMAKAVLRMPEYGERLASQGKVIARYHLVGGHGGAWIYDTESNEELELLLTKAPVFNFARYDIRPLAEMVTPPLAAPKE